MSAASTGYGKRATILDVAQRADVSFKTVSRVINGEAKVRPETRAKVMQAVKDLGYRPNHNARNLRAKRSRLIGLLVDNPSRNYLSELQWGAIQRCQDEGYVLSLETFKGMDSSALLRGGRDGVAGLILSPPLCEDPVLLDALREADIPFVQIAAPEHCRVSDCVLIDDRRAAREMTEHLIARGYSRIGYVSTPTVHTQTQERELGYREALMAAGLPVDESLIRMGAFTFETGRDAADALLSLAEPPTAIFASNDDMAAGVLAESYRRRMRVPHDLAIAGFDDTPLATVMTPSLTTVYQPVREMADAAVGMLLKRQTEIDSEPKVVTLPYEIRIRETTTGRAT